MIEEFIIDFVLYLEELHTKNKFLFEKKILEFAENKQVAYEQTTVTFKNLCQFLTILHTQTVINLTASIRDKIISPILVDSKVNLQKQGVLITAKYTKLFSTIETVYGIFYTNINVKNLGELTEKLSRIFLHILEEINCQVSHLFTKAYVVSFFSSNKNELMNLQIALLKKFEELDAQLINQNSITAPAPSKEDPQNNNVTVASKEKPPLPTDVLISISHEQTPLLPPTEESGKSCSII